MRRREKQITDRSQIEAIIARSQVCRLALSDGGQPYIVPLCFGYRRSRLYFHSAAAGRKIDILRRKFVGLEAIMAQYAGEGPHEFSADALAQTRVIRVTVEQMTGKQSV